MTFNELTSHTMNPCLVFFFMVSLSLSSFPLSSRLVLSRPVLKGCHVAVRRVEVRDDAEELEQQEHDARQVIDMT
jgi:hypothetical protein